MIMEILFNNKINKLNQSKEILKQTGIMMYNKINKKKYFTNADILETQKLPNTDTER